MHKIILALFLCLLNLSCFAASFNSKDGSFSISLPPKWQSIKLSNNEVLNLKKGESKINISKIANCSNLDCIKKAANASIKQIKNKKIKLIKNTYSGEEIRKGEFTTLDPYIYFSYNIAGKNYTEGYFLADSKGYRVLFSGVSYADADLFLSFIAPKPRDIQDLPLITDEEPVIEENIIAPEVQKPAWQPLSRALPSKEEAKPKEEGPKLIISKEFSTTVLIIFIYLSVAMFFFVYHFIFSSLVYKMPANPKSFYPIMGTRLYGSPDMFFKLYDSQGHNFIVTSQRWSSFLKQFGFYGAVLFALLHFLMASVKGPGLNSLWFNTVLSLCYLFVVFGLIFMCTGYILDMLFPANVYVYNDKGKILFKIVRRSSSFFKYSYLMMTSSSNIEYRMETNKLFFLRKWTMFDKDGQIAVIKENSFLRAFARKFFGHLGGTLRANYSVEGKNESKGQIVSFRKASTNFRIDIDKPQAFPHIAMLAAASVIFTKNRDKFYPWFD